eukprot:jgi/Mesen1/9068/ME000578S08311
MKSRHPALAEMTPSLTLRACKLFKLVAALTPVPGSPSQKKPRFQRARLARHKGRASCAASGFAPLRIRNSGHARWRFLQFKTRLEPSLNGRGRAWTNLTAKLFTI